MLHALPPSYRQRTLVQLEALIAQAERDLTRPDAGQTSGAEIRDGSQRKRCRLALLRRSREFLLSDEFSAVRGGHC